MISVATITIVHIHHIERSIDTCSHNVVIRVVLPLDIRICNTTDINTSTGCISIIIQFTILAVVTIIITDNIRIDECAGVWSRNLF